MRVRLVLSFAAVVLVAILSVVLIVRLDTNRQVQTFMLRGGMVGAQEMVQALEDYYQSNQTWDGVESLLVQGHRGRGQGNGMGQGMGMGMGMMNQRLQLADAGGRLLADTAQTPAQGTLTAEQLSQAIVLRDSRSKTVGYFLVNGGGGFQAGLVSPLFQRLNQAAIWGGLLAGALALGLALLLAARLLRPVQELTRAAKAMQSGDLSQRVVVHGSDEMAQLGETFNAMSASLAQLEQQRRALTADVAHELRTPLAVQRAQLEALQDGIYPLTVENLQPVLDQTALLTRLVEDLRTLALADAGELRLEKRAVDLAELTARVLERFQPSAEAHEVTLAFAHENGADWPMVEADPDRLAQIIHNLLSNALRHTPTGGRIDVRLSAAADRGSQVITVQDSGTGILPEALPYVFDRFYRVDRSRNREEGGTGLGLAISRQIALAHGGSLEAANAPKGGAIFTLRLPVSSQ